jgi:hypothetical protein
MMFDAQCDLAALVYKLDDDPDEVLRAFAVDLNARGFRAVGLVQLGHSCLHSKLSALLIHSGEELPLLQDLGTCAIGCRLDVDRLLEAGAKIACAMEAGADVVIINRFGRQERNGRGLSYLIDRAIEANIPVVIAVAKHRFADWIKFADGMSVKLGCDRHALDAWWHGVSARTPSPISPGNETICEILK